MFKSGFVNIIGRPNVGKSTLMNALVGERMSIITYKPQTTRHRILGIVSGENFQLVFSDTPGFVHDPSYKMHEKMNRYVFTTSEDADVMLMVVDQSDKYDEHHVLIQKLKYLSCPVLLIINKILDTCLILVLICITLNSKALANKDFLFISIRKN